MLVRISDDEIYARQRSDFFRSTLRVAAGDDDSGIGILPAHSSNGGSRILIRSRGHGAGVKNDERGIGGIRRARQSALGELALESGAIRLGGATAEVFDEESGHTLWYRTLPRLM